VKPLPATTEDLQNLRAARWIRESTKGQFDRYGPDAQRKLQDRAIDRLGLIDGGMTWSVAESGATVHQSPTMRALLEAARTGTYDVLVVGYVARWQQNLRQTLNLLEDHLHPAGVCVWFADEELLSSNERHWDQLVEEAKSADSWLRRHRRRVREGLAAKLATKRDPGGRPPFGLRRDAEKLIEPDPELLPQVRRVFELSSTGLTDREVSAQAGLPLFTVRGMLTSPLYVGRLRDGGPANWRPLIDTEMWELVQDLRARRTTNAGRPASPGRPYALSMLRCKACGVRLTGDTGYYRHRDPCAAFVAARPHMPPGMGRKATGRGYQARWYEDVVTELLGEIRLGDDVIAKVVSETRGESSPDKVALSRIERERATALKRLGRDRDVQTWEATMHRLDAEESDARAQDVDVIPAAKVVEYLRDLPVTWERASGGLGRRMLAEAVFSEIRTLGFKEMEFELTDEARRMGLGTALPEGTFVLGVSGYGRGERSSGHTYQLTVHIESRGAQPLLYACSA